MRISRNIWKMEFGNCVQGNNRIFYFFFQDDTYILLHYFRKKSQKTPRREIEKAKRERDDYVFRKENGKL